MTSVAIQKCAYYEKKIVEQKVAQIVADLGGIESYVKPGDTVLVKPNLLMAKPKEASVTTHPDVVRAVLKLVLKAGGKPIVGDSPGFGNGVRIAEKAGIGSVCREMDVPVIELNQSISVKAPKQHVFKEIELSREAVEADVVINLPKLKTHSQMILSLGVKNIFGCVVGRRKPQWHMKTGKDKALFAKVLVEIYDLISPELTIVDGIIGMEGDGPSNGTPKEIGLLLGATDCIALDCMISTIVGLSPEQLYTTQAAQEIGLGETNIDNVEILGDQLEHIKLNNFRMPRSVTLDFGLPPFLRHALKDMFSAKPIIKHDVCRRCKQCVDICPPQAMKLKSDKVIINYKECIRCFCCHEMCPYDAIDVKRGMKF